ncbi:MAG: HlyC/CorC family transporter [Rhodothermales bacterium]|nr:HlyC/CorC family transporter [Rhodothermales bacterium]
MILAATLLTLLLSAFFSGSEIAFIASNRLKVALLARREGFIGSIVRKFSENPETLLTTTLVGNNLALVAYSTLMAMLLEPPLRQFYEGVHFSATAADVSVLISQTIIAATVVLLIGEIIPKSILREIPSRAVIALALPLRITYYLFSPLIKIAGWTASGIIKLFRVEAETMTQMMRRDFELIIRESAASGDLELDEEESEFLSRFFNMESMKVRESMVPRTDVAAVDETTSIVALRQQFIESGHSKLPVYRDNIDTVIGIVMAYDLFTGPESISDIIRPVQFVPDSKKSLELLREFLDANISVAIVLDEYGGVAGLVTLEDLLEELIGDIQDEFDVEDNVIRKISDDTFVVSGRVELDTLRDRHGIEMPEGDYETVAGFILEHLGTIPTSRQEFEIFGYKVVVLQSASNRIDLIRLTLPEPVHTDQDSTSASSL